MHAGPTTERWPTSFTRRSRAFRPTGSRSSLPTPHSSSLVTATSGSTSRSTLSLTAYSRERRPRRQSDVDRSSRRNECSSSADAANLVDLDRDDHAYLIVAAVPGVRAAEVLLRE